MANHAVKLPRPRAAQALRGLSGRRFSALFGMVVLLGSLGFISWKIWQVQQISEHLRTLPVETRTPQHLHLEIVGRNIEASNGPNESASFELTLDVAVTRRGGELPEDVRLHAILVDGEETIDAFAAVQVAALKAAERRVVQVPCKPIPKPVAARARGLVLRAH